MLADMPCAVVPVGATGEDVLYVADAQLNIVFVNDAWRRFADSNNGKPILGEGWNTNLLANFSGRDLLRWQAILLSRPLTRKRLRLSNQPKILPIRQYKRQACPQRHPPWMQQGDWLKRSLTVFWAPLVLLVAAWLDWRALQAAVALIEPNAGRIGRSATYRRLRVYTIQLPRPKLGKALQMQWDRPTISWSPNPAIGWDLRS